MAWIVKKGARYLVRWDVGTPDNRKVVSESFNTFKEAEQIKKKVEYEASIGITIDPSNMSFGEYLEHWLDIHSPNLAPKTLVSYKSEINNHIIPQLGAIKLTKLSPMHLQNYYNFLLREGKARTIENRIKTLTDKRALARAQKQLDKLVAEGKTGLSHTTVRYQHRIIRKALKQAANWQMVARNVADLVEPPKAIPPDIEYMGRDEVNSFLALIKETYEYPVIFAAAYTGIRQGELLGLTWGDIDFNSGIMRVRQQLQYLPEKGFFYKEPKQNSKRAIPMPLPLSAVLRKLKKEQEDLKQIYKTDYKDDNLVFCNPDGSPVDGSGLTKRFQGLLHKNGFKQYTFHSLRHTFATLCRSAGLGIADIQDLLGHADISTTKNMYTHIEIEPLKTAMRKFTDFMGS